MCVSQSMFIVRHVQRHRTSGVHTDAVTMSSGTPGPPIITAILGQPPGRAAYSLAPPGRLKRVLDKAHLHLGELPIHTSGLRVSFDGDERWCRRKTVVTHRRNTHQARHAISL